MKVLILTSTPPLPPFSGGTINLYNLLPLLAARVEVSLLVIASTEWSERALRAKLADEGICVSDVCVVHQRHRVSNWHRLRALCLGEAPGPFFVESTLGRSLRQKLGEVLAKDSIDLVHVWGPSMAGAVKRIPSKKIVTFGDSFSLLHASYARSKGVPVSVYHALASKCFARYELAVLKSFDASVFFSERDRLHAGANTVAVRSLVISNGVSKRPAISLPQACGGVPVLAFHGQFSHYPNLEAARFMVHKVAPYLIERLGPCGFRLRFIGADPKGALRKLVEARPWCEHLGYVEDLSGALQGVAVYCAPVFSGAGVKNKVLDALALGLPIVSSSEAVAALPVRSATYALVAGREDFAATVLGLLENRALATRLARHAHDLWSSLPSWDDVAEQYLRLYEVVDGANS